jgi:hypothetical protein
MPAICICPWSCDVTGIQAQFLPAHSLLSRYAASGSYTDCYLTEVSGAVSQAEYVEAFYTTWLFRLERLILKWLVARPSTDDEAAELARGRRESFAAWTVEVRAADQLLMCDFRGDTRSWFMSEPAVRDGGAVTRLYFGSAVVAHQNAKTGERRLEPRFQALLGFHKLYSRALLRAARRRLLA